MVKIVELLLQCDANPGVVNGDGETALFCCWKADSETAGYECAALMLEQCDPSTFINIRSDKGQTILMKASFAGNKKFVELLLNFGADTLIKNHRGNTAIDIANLAGAPISVKDLLTHKRR